MSSIPFIDESVENRIKKIAPKLLGIIAQSKRVKEQLIRVGADQEKVHLMYPLVDFERFKSSDPPNTNIFKILFASAPNLEKKGENNFEDKGVPLLLEAFKEFIKEEDAILCILWRGKYNKELYQKINELDLKHHVKVIDKVVDMPEMYAKTHITVIPFLNLWRSPEIPMSALESLACGRPVVTTGIVEIAESVTTYKCGCVSKPVKEGFLSAFKKCKINYRTYQQNCLRAAQELFALNTTMFTQLNQKLGLVE